MRRSLPILTAAIWLSAALPVQASLAVRIGTASGGRGATVSVDVVVETDRADVSGIANTIGWTAGVDLLACSADPAVAPIAFFAFRPEGCEAQPSCSSLRGVVLGFGGVFEDGATLYRCEVRIAADAAAGLHPLTCSDAEGGSRDAQDLAADCIDGAVQVVVPTPTPTSTVRADPPTPSSTPTGTSAAPACAGDCDGNARVAIDELITAVRIALGTAAPISCSAADADGDDAVAIAELVRGVGNALRGC